MRRKEREITDQEIIQKILSQSSICRLAFNDEPYPYIVPMNYGYHDDALYFHCALEGRKLELIKKNSRLAFEIEYESEVIKGKVACQYTTRYRSVIGTGDMEIIQDDEQKRFGLDVLMRQHGKSDNTYIPAALKKTLVLKLTINSLSAKQAGDWE